MPRKPPRELVELFVKQTRPRRKVKKDARRQNRKLVKARKTAEPKIAAAVKEAVEATKRRTSTKAVAAAVKRGDLGAAASEVPWQDVGEPRLKAAYGEALQAAVKKAGIVTAEPVGAHFDVLDRRPLQWMEERSASFIREFGSMTQQGMRETLAEMVRSGMSVEKTAKLFRDQIGLTANLSKAVANYRAELEAKGMAAERIERLVERKTRQLLAYRGRLIARTEAQDAATFGQNEAWKQAADEGLIDVGTFEREWVTTSNPCPEVCDGMNGQRVKLGEKFLTDDGRYIDGPGGEAHPNCLCTVVGVHSERQQAA